LSFASIIYDVLAVVIVINCISRGAKNGFAKTAVQTVGYVCSAIAALVVASIAAALIYSLALEPEIMTRIEEGISGAADAESVLNGVTSAIEGLPAISGLLFDFGGVAETLAESFDLDYHEIAKNVSQTAIEPVVMPILRTVIFAFTLIILFAAVSLIAKGSKVVNDVPVIGKANGFFGGIFGIVNGALELCIAAVILNAVIKTGSFPEFFSEEIISKTILFRMIYFPVCGYID